jgi:hypothetical protein
MSTKESIVKQPSTAGPPTDDPYPILGIGEPILYGRSKDLTNVLRHLDKKTPDHVSVVGPRYIGKTTLVKHIAKGLSGHQHPFDGCIYWNTRSGVSDDMSFRREFGKNAYPVLNTISSTAGKALTGYNGESFEMIQLVFETLAEEKKRILVILDSFDEALLRSEITPNNWDNLRVIGEMSSVRFLTCTRRQLVDLCGRPESRQSPFFNLFAPPVSLGPLSESDIADLVRPFSTKQISLESGAEKEIFNWSGGVPIIASYICALLWQEAASGGVITRDRVHSAGERINSNGKDLLKMLWKDCDEDERADFADLLAGRIAKPHEIPRDRRDSLAQRGYIVVNETKLEPCCRVIEQYAKDHGTSSSGLRRLFENRAAFDTNIQAFLQLRFATLKRVDPNILNYIRLAIQEIDKPDVMLNQVRAAAGQALDQWLNLEFPDRKIPASWTDGWSKKDRDNNAAENNPPAGSVSHRRGAQCYLLRLVSDPRKSGKTRIRQSTALLIDTLQSVGDFGQHREGEIPPIMFGASVCLTAMQMAEQVAEDLAKPAV